MLHLKQSTASQAVLIGPFVDDTDGTTAETGLTIANTDIRLSKNGANIAAKNSGGGTHDELGFYQITLDATDTDTVGRLQLICKMSGALVVHAEFEVLEEAIYDGIYGASAGALATTANVSAVETDTQDIQSRLPAALVSGRIDASIDGTGMESGAVAAIVAGVFANVCEGSYTFLELLRGWTAALMGKASGLGTTTVAFRNTDDDVDVITATVDASGNRSAVTLDLDDTA